MIKAKGVKNGKSMTVIYDGCEYTFNGKTDYGLEAEIVVELTELHPIGGTYHPKDENEPLNIMNIIGNYFFDVPSLDIKVDEPAELPCEKRVVY